MNFGEALENLKAGKRVSRSGWNGKGMYIELQRPDLGSKMNVPYIYLVTPHGQALDGRTGRELPLTLVPWLASQTDLLAEDWTLA
jgi:hypothetical protein